MKAAMRSAAVGLQTNQSVKGDAGMRI